ncbi:MAG TPA: alpha/beta fold hydrolase [Stellaceae bacterium]|nr:alpha/beta fold hydrolase [Stellaceae bacterium]
MTTPETRFIPGRPRLAVDVLGSGPLVVFMHGIGGNRTNWRDQLPSFAAHFTAAAWDARGYGKSEDYEGLLDFADFGGDLLRLIDHFRADRAHLVGLSMGGRIAMDFHERHPERIASLTLCDTRAGLGSMTDEQRREFIRLRQEPLLAGKEPGDIAPAVARTLVSPHAVAGSYERLVESMTQLHKVSYLKSIAASVAYRREVQLEKIKVPTHVVVGADDTLTPPATARDMAARIPSAKLTVIEQAGHLSNIEQPQRFNAAVLGFLRGLG